MRTFMMTREYEKNIIQKCDECILIYFVIPKNREKNDPKTKIIQGFLSIDLSKISRKTSNKILDKSLKILS